MIIVITILIAILKIPIRTIVIALISIVILINSIYFKKATYIFYPNIL